jgi:hypothetical protein
MPGPSIYKGAKPPNEQFSLRKKLFASRIMDGIKTGDSARKVWLECP